MRRIVIAGTGADQTAADLFYAPLARALDAEVVALPRRGLGHPSEAAAILARRLLWENPAEENICLLGHSQGGLVALDLAYLDDRVTEVVTLGSPFAGTIWAGTWQPVRIARALARGSRYLRSLAELWESEYIGAYVHNVVGTDDAMVIPFTSGLLPSSGDDHVYHHVLAGLGHKDLAIHPRAIGYVSGLVAA